MNTKIQALGNIGITIITLAILLATLGCALDLVLSSYDHNLACVEVEEKSLLGIVYERDEQGALDQVADITRKHAAAGLAVIAGWLILTLMTGSASLSHMAYLHTSTPHPPAHTPPTHPKYAACTDCGNAINAQSAQ